MNPDLYYAYVTVYGEDFSDTKTVEKIKEVLDIFNVSYEDFTTFDNTTNAFGITICIDIISHLYMALAFLCENKAVFGTTLVRCDADPDTVIPEIRKGR